MVFLAILTGLGTVGNYLAVSRDIYGLTLALIIQVVLAVLTLIAAVGYGGRRTRPSYSEWGVRYFRIPFALIFLSIIGNAVMLFLLITDLNGMQNWFPE